MRLTIKSFERWDLPVSFLPVMMFSLPSSDVASIVRSDESLVPPRIMGSFSSTLASFSSIGIDSFLMVDWERLGSQLLLGLKLSFSSVALILHMRRLASWMYVMCGAISNGLLSFPWFR